MTQNVLRTRLRRPAGWLWVLVVALGGCDERGTNRAIPRANARPAAPSASQPRPGFSGRLVLERPPEPEADPAPPPGNLREEIDSFEDLAGCVKRHRLGDPLVADAVESLGYDSFITDACRSVEALRAKDTAPCAAMLTSAMRLHCETQVAMLTGKPELCPTRRRILGVPERTPLCLAAARRDVRPCAALIGMERATCEGLAAHDPARCGLDGRCLRLVKRWMPVLPVAVGRPAHAGHVQVVATRGEESKTLELAREAEQGAVVAFQEGKARLLLGDPRLFFLVGEEQGGGLVIELPSWPPSEPKWTLSDREVRGVLRMRQVGALELVHGAPVVVRLEQAPRTPNSAVVLEVEATLGPVHAPWKTRWKIDTWLRDVVEDGSPAVPAPSASGGVNR